MKVKLTIGELKESILKDLSSYINLMIIQRV